MIFTLESEPAVFKVNAANAKDTLEETNKNVYNHKQAALHHGLAAKYHLEAAHYHEEGSYYEAEESAFIAQGHVALAGQYQFETPSSLFNW